jgi:tRNA-dihydrouridine synthase
MRPPLPILVALLASSVATAQTPADIARCTAIDSNAERLACYDKLFVRSADQLQEQTKAATTVAAADAAAASASAGLDDFGLDGRKPAEQATTPKGPDEMQARIAKLDTQPRGEYVLTLANGQVWQQQEYDWHLAFKVGDEVIIKRGVLKSYRLQQKGNNRTTPVTRIR